MEAIVRYLNRKTAALAVVLMLGLNACADLDVVNQNAPDADRALSQPGDVQSLIQGAFGSWWLTSHHQDGSAWILGNVSFQNSSWPANFGMYFYSQLPRTAVVNDPTHEFYGNKLDYVWSRNYRALSAVAQGLNSLSLPEIAAGFTAGNLLRARAFGKFMQGMAHGSLALHYEEIFIVDETTDIVNEEQTAVGYMDGMNEALGYFDEAIALATGANFTIPATWMSVSVSAAELVLLARSMKARYRANVARNPDERQNQVDWNAVISDVDNGIGEWVMDVGFFLAPFWNAHVGQMSSRVGWAQASYMIDGMADQSGNYQRWLNSGGSNPETRFPDLADGSAVLIHTPDTRWPSGATKAAQEANPGSMRIAWAGSRGQPSRGTHRWSHYFNTALDFHRDGGRDVPEITTHEMRLLKAEGLIRLGGVANLAEAALLINETRVDAGLNPTDAVGTNTSCVPRLPNGECGDLMEMLKWEKRLHTAFFGVHTNSWYFDGRGWGDLYLGSPLSLPLPCLDAELLFLPCSTTGGVGGAQASPGSVYNLEGSGFPETAMPGWEF
jgi:hypothetical protein